MIGRLFGPSDSRVCRSWLALLVIEPELEAAWSGGIT